MKQLHCSFEWLMGSLSLNLFGFCIFTFALLGPLGHRTLKRISDVDSDRTTKVSDIVGRYNCLPHSHFFN